MAEDKRIDEEGAGTEENPDVEGHGVKEVAGVGLAAAALIGAGAVGVKVARDDDASDRNVGALLSPEARFAEADRDRDGYVTQPELAPYSLKFSTNKFQEEGVDVSEEGLSAAGYKLAVELIGKEDGFSVEGDTVMLKQGVTEELDKLAEGIGLELTKKLRELDRDGDGYASSEELAVSDWYKWDVDELNAAGYKVTSEDLAKAEYKMDLALLGEGGFVTKEDMILLKQGVDSKLDELLDKWRG
jgi:hypothetical protein